MTSISNNKNVHGSAVLQNSMAKTNNINGNSDCFEAETIEVVPELPLQDDDSDAGYSEFSDEFNSGMDEDEPFDEYGEQKPTPKLDFLVVFIFFKFSMELFSINSFVTAYQVSSNHRESPPSHALWVDNSKLKAMPLAAGSGETKECDVILIDDEEEENENKSDNQFAKKHSSRGLPIHDQQKFHICEICHSKLSSSYNLKRLVQTLKIKFCTGNQN